MGYLYREEPDSGSDSGWRLFRGLEDQVYADDPLNFEIYSFESVLLFDSTVFELLLKGEVGSKYERTNAGDFILIED